MLILPAIDIIDGNCVRLMKGDYSTAYKVADSIIDTAKSFEEAGAKFMHMVDLDGAKDGKRINSDAILSVRKNCDIKIEVGGGIRSMDSVEFYLKNGIDRIILGTSAINDPDFVREAVNKYQDKIAVGIDAKNGFVSADGWTDTSEVNYIDLAKQMVDIGVKYIIFTDISRDGMLSGPNLTMLDELKSSVSCNIIASGGVSSLKDIINLTDLDIYGAICGKAIYSGNLDLAQAMEVAHAAKHNGKGANL